MEPSTRGLMRQRRESRHVHHSAPANRVVVNAGPRPGQSCDPGLPSCRPLGACRRSTGSERSGVRWHRGRLGAEAWPRPAPSRGILRRRREGRTMPRAHTVGALLVAVLATAACGNGSTGTPDAEDGADAPADEGGDADAAEGGDADAADGEGDAGDAEDGAPGETYCRSCRWDDECAPGDLCATLEGIEMACAALHGDRGLPVGAEAIWSGGHTACRCSAVGRSHLRDLVARSSCRAWGAPAGTTRARIRPGRRTGSADVPRRPRRDPGYNRCADRGDGVLICFRCFRLRPSVAGRTRRPPASARRARAGALHGDADTCLSSVDEAPDLCSAACEDLGLRVRTVPAGGGNVPRRPREVLRPRRLRVPRARSRVHAGRRVGRPGSRSLRPPLLV